VSRCFESHFIQLQPSARDAPHDLDIFLASSAQYLASLDTSAGQWKQVLHATRLDHLVDLRRPMQPEATARAVCGSEDQKSQAG
jgi:hypothetical protein